MLRRTARYGLAQIVHVAPGSFPWATFVTDQHGRTPLATEIVQRADAAGMAGASVFRLARAIGVSQPAVARYLDALSEALVVRQVQPWFANVGKRQLRSPKVYVRDTGLLHRLLGIGSHDDLLAHPKVGASWEGFVVEQILALDVTNPWFWGTHAGAELDLLVDVDGGRVGIEIKRTDQPRLTPSMRSALDDLQLDRLIVVHAGAERFSLADRVEAIPAPQVLSDGL